MSFIHSSYGDVFDSVNGNNVEPTDQNANGALCKFQDDARPTTLVQQAVEQNSTGLVREALAQSASDTVIRNIEGILSGGFIHFDKPNGQSKKFVLEAKEREDKPVEGLHKWFSEDLETNLINNASETLTRGTALEMLATKPKDGELRVGTVGYLQGLDPEDFWHSKNDKADLSKYVKQNVTAVKFESAGVNKAISALDERISQNLKDVKSGQKLDANQTDRMRQMAENTAMMKLAVAESLRATDPKAAKELVSGKGNSVTELIRIAENHGANKDNIQQLNKMVEQFNKRD